MNYPVNTWLTENGAVFRVIETGEYRRGSPVSTNEFYLRVQVGHNVGKTEADASILADRVAEMLNRQDRLHKLEQQQAPGRNWIVYHADAGTYYNDFDGLWYFVNSYASQYGSPFEATQVIERLEKKSQNLTIELNYCVLPMDDAAKFKSPINSDGKPFVVLRGIEQGNTFFCCSSKGENPTVLANGRVAYEVVGYCDTSEQALSLISSTPHYDIRYPL